METVPVQMNRVLLMEVTGLNFMILELPFGVTYWAASGTTGNCQLNALVRLETIDTAFGEKIRRFLGPTQDLEQNRDTGGIERNTVDLKGTDTGGSVLISGENTYIR